MAAERPDEGTLRRLDASVKRNSALTKKLRGISEEGRAALLEDISRTNQSKVEGEGPASATNTPASLRWTLACLLFASQRVDSSHLCMGK